MRNRIVLALDIGTALGWAVQLADGRVQSGRHELPKGQRQGVRLHAFRVWLVDQLTRLGEVDTVIWEHAHQQLGSANEVHHNLVGVLLDFAERNRVTDYHSVEVSTLKAFATGSGTADKAAMINAARAAGYPVRSHDEADAIHLLRYEIHGQREADLPRLAEARAKRKVQAKKRREKAKVAANQNAARATA
ncbi:hypothetical protein ACIU1J_27570 [Azospirillum doebereinerae]|uniref:hypothetical protein n=1 Tax=Azospirillum doebereinerae TaxID=92933 RepID=UPI001EE532C6|nr:hypothetical protein [Azospirillum doebereinerae]MCG5241380.1 hypothetical protein [Azospirillum doebereinerae]